jgi:hypothetical protein
MICRSTLVLATFESDFTLHLKPNKTPHLLIWTCCDSIPFVHVFLQKHKTSKCINKVELVFEGLIRRLWRGRWMGVDKNSYQGMNSAYVLISQPRIPTRFCQGCIVTTDLPTLGTNPNSKQHGRATQEPKDLGNLHSLGRTVRVEGADCPQGQGRPSASTGWLVRKCHPNFQYCTSNNWPSARRRLFALTPRTVRQTSSNQKYQTKRILTRARKNMWRTRRTAGWKPPRRLSSRDVWIVRVMCKQ